jgi:hypothetical protein
MCLTGFPCPAGAMAPRCRSPRHACSCGLRLRVAVLGAARELGCDGSAVSRCTSTTPPAPCLSPCPFTSMPTMHNFTHLRKEAPVLCRRLPGHLSALKEHVVCELILWWEAGKGPFSERWRACARPSHRAQCACRADRQAFPRRYSRLLCRRQALLHGPGHCRPARLTQSTVPPASASILRKSWRISSRLRPRNW